MSWSQCHPVVAFWMCSLLCFVECSCLCIYHFHKFLYFFIVVLLLKRLKLLVYSSNHFRSLLHNLMLLILIIINVCISSFYLLIDKQCSSIWVCNNIFIQLLTLNDVIGVQCCLCICFNLYRLYETYIEQFCLGIHWLFIPNVL